MNIFHHPQGPNISATFHTNHSGITSITLAEHNQPGCCWQLEIGTMTGLINCWMTAYCEKRETPPLPLEWPPFPPFSRLVLEALSKVPFGQTLTYQQLASSAGRPKASRAAGSACGRNPFPLVIPCHRIVGSGGKSLGGFAFGLKIKRELLSFENSSYSMS